MVGAAADIRNDPRRVSTWSNNTAAAALPASGGGSTQAVDRCPDVSAPDTETAARGEAAAARRLRMLPPSCPLRRTLPPRRET
ncbi:unnamed protein product [Ectocarpus sp. 12 AP-2014]